MLRERVVGRLREWSARIRRREGGTSREDAARGVLSDATVVIIVVAVIAFIVVLAVRIL